MIGFTALSSCLAAGAGAMVVVVVMYAVFVLYRLLLLDDEQIFQQVVQPLGVEGLPGPTGSCKDSDQWLRGHAVSCCIMNRHCVQPLRTTRLSGSM